MNDKEIHNYAGFWLRLASVCVDAFLISVIIVVSVALVGSIVHSSMSTGTFLRFILLFMIGVFVITTILYFAWFNSNAKQSPGKKLFGIAVRDSNLRGIPFSQSLYRAIVYLFDYLIFGIGHLLIIFNPKKRALHDIVAKTVVVRVGPKMRFEPLFIVVTIFVYFFIAELPASFLRTNFIQAFRIPTGSHKPTLLIGDYVLVDKHSPLNLKPKPSEWITFKYPRDENLDYIKRCIAVGGQTVNIKNGAVFVDGEAEGDIIRLEKEYDPEEGREVENLQVRSEENVSYVIRQYAEANRSEYGPMKIPDGHYFVLGDNRDNSADSRHWGFVPEKNIIGKGAFIYFSWDNSQSKIRWSRIGKIVE